MTTRSPQETWSQRRQSLSSALDSNSSPTGLASLPAKLVALALRYLDALEIVNCQLVSRQIRDIIHQSTLLQYIIECDLAGVVDGSASRSIGLEDCLDAVKTWRKAWRSPPWQGQPTTTVTMYQSPAGASALVGTVYADINPEDDNGFAFSRLPSPHRRVTEEHWAVEALPDWSEQYTFDHAQDLLVLPQHVEGTRELNLNLLSCTTGRAHPAAFLPVIQLTAIKPISLQDDDWTFHVHISSDLVGIAISHDGSGENAAELWILDWKQGVFLLNVYNDTDDRFQLHSFTFLDATQILLLVKASYTMPDLVVIECARGSFNERTSVEDILDRASLILGLPDLGEDDATDTITIDCRPHQPHLLPGELFKQTTALPVILVAYRSHWDYDPACTFDLLIPARVIASRLAAHTQHPPLLWAEWCAECRQVNGPDRGTLFPLSRVCGPRYITTFSSQTGELDADGGPVVRREVCIYDFDSVPALRRAAAAGEAVVVHEPTVVDSPFVQGEPTVELSTEAPFRKLRTGVVVDDDAEVCIAEDGFVVRRRGERENYVSLEVYTI